MVNIVNKISGWYKSRKEERKKKEEDKIEEIINQYTPEEQKLIKKGRNVNLSYSCDLEKITNEYFPNSKLILLSDEPMPYSKRRALIKSSCKEERIKYWLELGKKGVNLLVGIHEEGPDSISWFVGYPVQIVKK